jgi:RNA polymerase sigma factor (TIGR02999 family)
MAPTDVTGLLDAWAAGDAAALAALTPLVYDVLRDMAAQQLGRERAGHTLQPTALIHEAFIRLVDQNVSWQNRAHFFGVASRIMRRILVDHARRANAEKRGGGARATAITVNSVAAPMQITDLDRALVALAEIDERKAQVVEMRYFGGLTAEEVASVLGVSVPTVHRDSRFAEAWLKRQLSAAQEQGESA